MARTPMVERDMDKYVPRFKEEHVSPGGRQFGIRKVPQTAMFEITGEGAGDLPKALKGRFTGTQRAERALKAYLNQQRQALEAEQAKQLREEDEPDAVVDILGPSKVEKDVAPVEKTIVTTDKVEDTPVETLDKSPAAKGGSKVPVTAKSGNK